MIKVMWPILWIATVIFGLAYIRMRDKIYFKKRERWEKITMIMIIIFLLVNIGFQVVKRKDMALTVNDCIRYYRENPYSDGSQYNFIQECKDILNKKEFEQIKNQPQGKIPFEIIKKSGEGRWPNDKNMSKFQNA